MLKSNTPFIFMKGVFWAKYVDIFEQVYYL